MKKPISFQEIRPFVRLARRFSLPHKNSFYEVVSYDVRLFFCVEGGGVVTVSGRPFSLGRGDLLLLPPGSPYTFESPERDGVYLIVNFDYTQENAHLSDSIPPVPTREFREEDAVSPVLITDEPMLNEPLFLCEMHKLAEPLSRLVVVLSRKVIYYEREAAALLESILLECVRTRRLGSLSHGRAPAGAVLDHLHEHYAEHLTNQTVAEALGYHPNYVSELVKQATGVSLHRYLTSIRIKHAIDLLEEGERTVGEIATLCGFGDIYHFSKSFKQVTGLSPTRYRLGGTRGT